MFDLLLALGISALMVLGASVAVPGALPVRVRPRSWAFLGLVCAVAAIMLTMTSLLHPDRL